MSTSTEQRWLQRLDSFGMALAQLATACEREHYDNLERAGLIKTFEFCFELLRKVLKDLLNHEGIVVKVPRAAIRNGSQVGYINERDWEMLLDALYQRNLMNHTCWSEAALDAETVIRESYCPHLQRLHRNLDARRTS